MTSRLTALQLDLLEAFFERCDAFFLTGGAALAQFHLGHRSTLDLDLFTTDERLEDGERALEAAARSLGASVERVQTAPDFRRRVVKRGAESVVVDLVRERVEQGARAKLLVGRIRVDPPEEILANKLCTLLSRAELRDLVDAMHLERIGCSLSEALALGARKDGGLTPAQLAWVLGELRIGDDARSPDGSSPQALRDYVRDLRTRLESAAFP